MKKKREREREKVMLKFPDGRDTIYLNNFGGLANSAYPRGDGGVCVLLLIPDHPTWVDVLAGRDANGYYPLENQQKMKLATCASYPGRASYNVIEERGSKFQITSKDGVGLTSFPTDGRAVYSAWDVVADSYCGGGPELRQDTAGYDPVVVEGGSNAHFRVYYAKKQIKDAGYWNDLLQHGPRTRRGVTYELADNAARYTHDVAGTKYDVTSDSSADLTGGEHYLILKLTTNNFQHQPPLVEVGRWNFWDKRRWAFF